MFLLLLQLCRGQRALNHTVVSARPLRKIHRFQFPNTCLHFEKRLIFYSNQQKQNQSHNETTSRKYSLIAGTTACAALMSSFVVSNPNIHINIWHAHSGSHNNDSKNSPKNDGINNNQLPLFMPHKPIVTNCNDTPSDNNNNCNFLNINNKQSELNDLKLQLIYNYARQCRILGKPTKESMIDWLETEIEKHNNFINNNNTNNNNTNENTNHKHDKFKLDKSSVYLGNIDETGQRYLLYTIINENDTNERYQYIVIRGTKNWKNMKSHMKSELIYDDSFGMYLHSGYSDATHKILNDIIQHIDTNCKLRLTGHSYGGVLCTLLGYYLSCVNENLDNNNNNNNDGNGNAYKSNVRYNIEQIVTFGMPEFADKESSFNLVHNNINLPLIRVEHINDYIARFDWNRYNQLRIKNLVLNKLVNKIKKNNNNNNKVTDGNETTVSKQFIKTIAAMRYTPDDINDTSIATADTAAAAVAASIGIFERNNNKYSNNNNNHIQYGAAKRYTKDKNENGKSVNQVFYVGIDDSDDTLTGESTNDTSVRNTRQDIAAVTGMTSLFTNSLKNMNNFELSKYFISRPRCIHRMRDYQIAIESQLFNNGCTNSSTPVSSSSD